VTETAIRVRVCDETGDVVLPERAVVRARAAASSHEELSSVHDGDEVEIVCRGRRKPRAGETYRACASEFEIDADVPVEVWVERRRG
jgi:hypothetical protein